MSKSLKVKCAVVAAFAALASVSMESSAQAAGVPRGPPTANVNVINTPLPVQGTVNIINTPLPVEGTVSIAAGEPINARNVAGGISNQLDTIVYTIPAGKRLIIDYVSARGVVPAGESVSSIFFSLPVVHYLVVVSQGTDLITGGNVFTAAQSLRIALGPFAADQGIRMRMERSASGTSGSFSATLAGQLVDP